jgi:hypothetical protein
VSLGPIHDLMERREWAQAERALRGLMLQGDDPELRLLLAEVYLEGFGASHLALIDQELRGASRASLTKEQQHRMSDLQARRARIQRGPL